MKMRLLCNNTRILDATWEDVESVMDELKHEAYFELSVPPKNGTGPVHRISVESENGYYRPMLALPGGGGKGFNDPDAWGKEMVEIGGYDYDPMSVTRDFEQIKEMIQEFYRRGNVSSDLWHPRKKKVTDNILFKLWRSCKKK